HQPDNQKQELPRLPGDDVCVPKHGASIPLPPSLAVSALAHNRVRMHIHTSAAWLDGPIAADPARTNLPDAPARMVLHDTDKRLAHVWLQELSVYRICVRACRPPTVP